MVRRKMKLKKNNQYIVRLRYSAQRVLDDLGILQNLQIKERVPLDLLKDEWMVRSYLRGPSLLGDRLIIRRPPVTTWRFILCMRNTTR